MAVGQGVELTVGGYFPMGRKQVRRQSGECVLLFRGVR